MYRDTLIPLILKEIFKDPYLVNTIYHIIENDEINEMLLIQLVMPFIALQLHLKCVHCLCQCQTKDNR